MKYIILQGDGMPDHRVDELGGKTPLNVARTPNMDFLASHGTMGLVRTIPQGMHPGSDVGNLSLFGYDPKKYSTGRSPLEAASIGVKLSPDDVAFRINLVTLQKKNESYYMDDYSSGHISTPEAKKLIRALRRVLEDKEFIFYAGLGFRHLMVWKKGKAGMTTTPPHDIMGKEITVHLPRGEGAEALIGIMEASRDILKDNPVNKLRARRGKKPANSVWLWGQGRPPRMPKFRELYGVKGAVVAAVDIVKGLGFYAGLSVINVSGATGFLDTNFIGKARAALRLLNNHDLVYVHVEAPDEASHMGDVKAKIKAIEDFDEMVVGTIIKGTKKFKDFRILLCSDHPTPLDVRTHVSEPVPFVIYPPLKEAPPPRREARFDEISAKKSGIFIAQGDRIMGILLGRIPII